MASGSFDKQHGTKAASPAARHDAPDDLSELDFSIADPSLALAECAGLVEVHDAAGDVAAVYEEAAVLYANGSDVEARELLESAMAGDPDGAGEGLWMMLLDLYRLTGERDRFESRVLDYATRFERSPPPWVNLGDGPRRPRAQIAPLVNLAGRLDQSSTTQLQQLVVIGQKTGSVRIDLKRVRGADDAGCALLLDAVRTLARERARVSLLNAEALAEVLAGSIEPGRAQRREAWLLLLELLQHCGGQERFDAVALDYAVTFEESPPSWEAGPLPQSGAHTAVGAADDGDDDAGSGPCLEGELSAGGNEPLRRLAALANDSDKSSELVVDCSRLRRLDFVSAGTLFNILSTLRAQGKLVTLLHVNAMVAALLRVMGVDQVAQVRLRS